MEQCISGQLACLRWTLTAVVGPEAMDSIVVREKWVESRQCIHHKVPKKVVRKWLPLCSFVQALKLVNREKVQRCHVNDIALT